jgi:polysaccharide transporter, PST family
VADISELPLDVDTPSLKRRSVKGGVTIIVAQVFRLLIRLTAQVAVARLLLPGDYGLIAMAAPVIALVQLVANLGLGQAVIQHPDIRQDEVSSLFWLGLVINIFMSVLVGLFSPILAWLYHDSRLILVCIVLAGLIPISGLTTQPAALLSRNLRFGTLALLDVAPPAVNLSTAFVAAWFGWGCWSLIVGMASESVFGAVLLWCVSTWRPSLIAFNKSTWGLVAVGGHLTLFKLAQYLTTTCDNILISTTQGAIALGLYDKAYKTVTLTVGQLLAPTNQIALPLLTRLLREPDRYKRAYVSMLQIPLLFGAPGILYVLVFAKPLMSILLGSNWNGIAPMVSWLCLGSLASPLYSSSYWLFVSQGRAREQVRYGIITSVISIVSFVAGLPWGPAGVAAGAGLSFFFLCTPLTCWAVTRAGPVNSGDLLFAVLPMAAASLAAVGALLTISRIAPTDQLGPLTLAFLAAHATFFAFLFCLPSGRRLIQNTWRLHAAFSRE